MPAKNFTEMGPCYAIWHHVRRLLEASSDKLGKTKLEDFAKTFAAVYNAN
jgi:hypothetical protein